MSDLLGPLLGLSPFSYVSQSCANPDVFTVVSPLAVRSDPLPEPGIHWTRTGGKSWRVLIVR